MSAECTRLFDRRLGAFIHVEFKTARREIVDYAVVLLIEVDGEIETVRLYDGAPQGCRRRSRDSASRRRRQHADTAPRVVAPLAREPRKSIAQRQLPRCARGRRRPVEPRDQLVELVGDGPRVLDGQTDGLLIARGATLPPAHLPPHELAQCNADVAVARKLSCPFWCLLTP